MTIPHWLVQLSVWANDRTGGPQGYSLCARMYENRLEGHRVSASLVKITDTLFWFDEQHCRKAWLLRQRIN